MGKVTLVEKIVLFFGLVDIETVFEEDSLVEFSEENVTCDRVEV